MPLSRNSLEILVLVVLVLAVLILAVLVLVVLIILVLAVLGAVLAIFRIVCVVVVIVIVVHFVLPLILPPLSSNPIWLSVTGVVWQNRTKNMPNFFSTLVLLFY